MAGRIQNFGRAVGSRQPRQGVGIGICHTFLSNFTGALDILLVRAGKGWDELDEKSFWVSSHLQGCACAGGNLTFLECFLRWCWK